MYAYEEQSMKLHHNDVIPPLELTDIEGRRVEIPPSHGLVHLQLRRFAGCPVCNLHLRTMVRARDALERAAVHEVIVFHSPAEQLRNYVERVPFVLVADPHKQHYRELGAETGARSVLDPRGWPGIVHGLSATFVRALRGTPAPMLPYGGPLGLPAEFLIDARGRIVASKYGEHVDDQWTVDELIAFANRSHANTPTEAR